jgi:hypothetical protein
MTKLEAKTRNLIVNLAHKIEDSVTVKSHNSEIAEYGFMKTLDNTAFKDFCGAFNNKLKYGMTTLTEYDISFCPAYNVWTDFKISHKMSIYFFYSKKKDKTYMFITDHGYIDFRDICGDASQIGTTAVFPGKIDFEKLTETPYYKDLIERLYNEKDLEIKKFSEEHKEEVA